MRCVLLLVILLGAVGSLDAQIRVPFGQKKAAGSTTVVKVKGPQVGVADLIEMLNWTTWQIDTTLKKKGYLLMQKEVDSTSSLFQYSNVSRLDDAPTTVRSLSLMDATVGNIQGRMISYRTYDKNEYRDISSYLLANNYHKTNEFDFDEAKHTLYSNGSREIRLKVITTIKDKRTFTAYEIELGK